MNLKEKRERKKNTWMTKQYVQTRQVGNSQGRGRKDITKNKKYLNVSKKNWNSLDSFSSKIIENSFSSKIIENGQMGEQTKEILEN